MEQKQDLCNGVYLKMLLTNISRVCVCECGEVLDDVTIHYKFDETIVGNEVRTFDCFVPECCPSCGRTIMGVFIDRKTEECGR